jgi:hypothetical protein
MSLNYSSDTFGDYDRSESDHESDLVRAVRKYGLQRSLNRNTSAL